MLPLALSICVGKIGSTGSGISDAAKRLDNESGNVLRDSPGK